MKNKFEALSAFQQWPEDWQRLCAEYWAENDKPSGSVATSLHPLWAELHQRASKVAEECYPQAVAKVVENVKPAKRKAPSRPWTVMEQEYLAKCANNCQTQIAACKMFLQKYPGRNIGAVQIRYYLMAKNNWKINY